MTTTKEQIKKSLEEECLKVEDNGRVLIGRFKEEKQRRFIPRLHYHMWEGTSDNWYDNSYELWREGDIERVRKICEQYKKELPEFWPFFIFEIPTWWDYHDYKPKNKEDLEYYVVNKLGRGRYFHLRVDDIDKVIVPIREYKCHAAYDSFFEEAMRLIGANPQDSQQLKCNNLYFIRAIHSGIGLTRLPRFTEILEEIDLVCKRLKFGELSDALEDQKNNGLFESFRPIKGFFEKAILDTLKEVYGVRFVEECNFIDTIRTNESSKEITVEFDFDFEKVYNMARTIGRIKPILLKYI
ncbi:hypothetical protein KY342_07095 [Candidatus Woesearchaeota archaeon]|nr:hypothetical protein [Candidatus Woesearchaeota archaeon]